jgi:ribosome-associated protein
VSAETKPQITFVNPTNEPSCLKALTCATLAIEKKGENVKVLELKNVSGYTDYFVIASGMSNKQIQAIADSIEEKFKEKFKKSVIKEGYTEGRWILLDLGDVVVHLFLDALRSYYQIEAVWNSAPYIRLPSAVYGNAVTPE